MIVDRLGSVGNDRRLGATRWLGWGLGCLRNNLSSSVKGDWANSSRYWDSNGSDCSSAGASRVVCGAGGHVAGVGCIHSLGGVLSGSLVVRLRNRSLGVSDLG